MKEILRKNKAITLVSLVVTIIILIILAGVSINLVLGKNGIITIAKQAKENTELAKIEEEVALNELYMQIESEGGTTGNISYDAIAKLVEFKREIASAISDMGITTSEDADASTMASNIRNISGASSADKVSYDNTNSGLEATNVQGAVDEVNNNLSEYELNSGSTVLLVSLGNKTSNTQFSVDTTPYKYIMISATNSSKSQLYGATTYPKSLLKENPNMIFQHRFYNSSDNYVNITSFTDSGFEYRTSNTSVYAMIYGIK